MTGPHEQAPGPHEQAPGLPAGSEASNHTPGFSERGRMRRRARFLRKARELAFRDLGGLVFDMHRFGERNDQVLAGKLATLRQIDIELRALQDSLREGRPMTVLHEVGIAACPRCAAIHGRDDRFCPGCGLAFDVHAERPLATAPIKIPEPPSNNQASAPPRTAAWPAPTAPPAKPTAEPVAAQPPAQTSQRPAQASQLPAKASQPPPSPDEDQPTEILRPSAGDA